MQNSGMPSKEVLVLNTFIYSIFFGKVLQYYFADGLNSVLDEAQSKMRASNCTMAKVQNVKPPSEVSKFTFKVPKFSKKGKVFIAIRTRNPYDKEICGKDLMYFLIVKNKTIEKV